MNSFIKSFLVGAILCSAAFSVTSSPARAEIFFVEDQDDRFSVSFPDLWKKVSNQKPDDKLTIIAPGVNDHAGCRVRVRGDRRFVIFPDKFNDDIQKVAFSREFWDDYLGEYNDIEVEFFKDEAGLGFGHASMIDASYETTGGPIVRKRGIMFASLYHDQLYVVECSSEESLHSKWRRSFLGVIKSVDFGKVTHENKSGHYRPFMGDGPVEVQGPKSNDIYKF